MKYVISKKYATEDMFENRLEFTEVFLWKSIKMVLLGMTYVFSKKKKTLLSRFRRKTGSPVNLFWEIKDYVAK